LTEQVDLRERGSIPAVAFSPDGKTLAVSSDDNTMMLWDIAGSPRLLTTLTMTGYTGEGIAFSPDGRTLATGWNRASGNGDTLILWDVSDPARPVRLATRTGTDAEQLAFSPDGRLLAGSTSLIQGNNSGVVTRRSGSTLWDVPDPADPRQLAPRLLPADGALAFSPDSRTLAISDGASHVQRWDIADPSTPKRIATLVGHTAQVNALAFSPDGRALASGSMDDDAILWNTSDLNNVTRMATLAGDPTGIDAVAFTQDGRYLLTDDDDIQVDRWSAVPHQPFVAATLTRHTGAVESVAISPDNQILATGGFDQTVSLWNITDPERSCGCSPTRARRWPRWLAGWSRRRRQTTVLPAGCRLAAWPGCCGRSANRPPRRAPGKTPRPRCRAWSSS
jgi:WD40 repeat protein